ncbi:uncharacterized protein LOC126815536 [Patella vulgata]|uniref:uncharacterized protein LOC126815536 n=1 Tax=Patella vulgata TaxID=6465 RepID=UPI0024A9AEB7|nr:uncharacterized protein LOC126815536 [Patella vulgata]
MKRGLRTTTMKTCALFLLITAYFESIVCQEQISTADWAAVTQTNPRVLVLFYDQSKPPSEDIQKLFTTYTAPTGFTGDLKVVQSTDTVLANSFGITEFPSVLFNRDNSPVPYDGDINDEELSDWLIQAQEVATKVLVDLTFEHQTQAITGGTTGDWLVVFYKDSCSSSLTTFETVAVRLKGKTNVAKVNIDENPKLVSRFAITKCPTTIFFRQGTMYRHEVDKYTVKILLSFVQAWYRNMKAEKIPFEPTAFDKATENIALFIKKQLNGPNRKIILGVGGGIGGLLALIILVCCCRRAKSPTKEKTQ